jgi:hypothetical protein
VVSPRLLPTKWSQATRQLAVAGTTRLAAVVSLTTTRSKFPRRTKLSIGRLVLRPVHRTRLLLRDWLRADHVYVEKHSHGLGKLEVDSLWGMKLWEHEIQGG